MSVPNWVAGKYGKLWSHPWNVSPNRMRHRAFKKALWNHGYLSPHFTKAETASHGSDGTHQIPDKYRGRAQKCAFKAEKVRHDCGDRPLTFLDWYRTPHHNDEVGGASQSQHMTGNAFDPNQYDSQHSNSYKRRFRTGGIGTNCAQGYVMHVDSRGYPARWCY